MQRVAEGDVAAFEGLVRRFWGEVKLYALHLAQDPDLAEDLAQDAFAQLWRARTRWVERGSVRVWLLRTARNAFLSQQRKRRVREAWAESADARTAPPRPSPLALAERSEARSAIRKAVAGLSPRRREAFTLVHLQGLTYREAARVMDVREQTVANYLQAAVSELRDRLANFHTGSGR